MHTAKRISPGFNLLDVRSEQIRIIYAAVPSSLVTVLIVSLSLAVFLWSVVDPVTIIGWLMATNLLSLMRLLIYLRFQQLEPGSAIDDLWRRLAIYISVASGITWGTGGFFLFAEHSLVHQVSFAFVIAGMCSDAITTLSPVLEAARGFVMLAVLPILIKFNLAHSEFAVAMTLVAALFIIMILHSATRINQSITESLQVRRKYELAAHTISHQAHFDALTDLPNRRLMLSTLRQEMVKAKRYHHYGAVFFVDIDRFKMVNDSFGHAIGDQLLVKVARLIAQRLRKKDTVARMGGDEFIVLLPEVGTDYDDAASQAVSIADQVRQLFRTPFLIEGQDIHTTVSIGIAIFPAAVPVAVPAEDLLKYADVAMYRAKRDGRDAVRLFSTELHEAENRLRVVR